MSNKKKATPAKRKKSVKKKSWAELAAERQVEKEAIYQFKIVEGMDPFTFRKEEIIDILEAGKLPDEMAQFIYEKYIEGSAGKTEEEIKANVIQQFSKHMEMSLHIACCLSLVPRLTMDPMINGKDEFPVKLLTQGERFRLITAMSRITMEAADKLKPFRVQPTDPTHKSDGPAIRVPTVGSAEMVAD